MKHSGFNPSLHGLRGLAAIAVLLFHWSQVFTAFAESLRTEKVGSLSLALWLDFGWLGVPLFFILSGYLLTTQLVDTELSGSRLKKFWLRRLCRIYPAFWFQFFLLMGFGGMVAGITAPSDWGEGIRNFLLFINLPPWMTKPLNGVWWTLPIELSFYLLLPFIMLLEKRMNWVIIVIVALLITCLWRAAVMYFYRDLPTYLLVLPILDAIPGTIATFICGFALAFIPPKYGIGGNRNRLLILGLSVFVLLLAWISANLDTYWTGHWMLTIWNPLTSIVLATLVFCFVSPANGNWFLGSKIMVWLGEISFGIYLWHFPVMLITYAYWGGDLVTPTGNLLALALCTAVTLVIASLSFLLIEKPAMKWRRQQPLKN